MSAIISLDNFLHANPDLSDIFSGANGVVESNFTPATQRKLAWLTSNPLAVAWVSYLAQVRAKIDSPPRPSAENLDMYKAAILMAKYQLKMGMDMASEGTSAAFDQNDQLAAWHAIYQDLADKTTKLLGRPMPAEFRPPMAGPAPAPAPVRPVAAPRPAPAVQPPPPPRPIVAPRANRRVAQESLNAQLNNNAEQVVDVQARVGRQLHELRARVATEAADQRERERLQSQVAQMEAQQNEIQALRAEMLRVVQANQRQDEDFQRRMAAVENPAAAPAAAAAAQEDVVRALAPEFANIVQNANSIRQQLDVFQGILLAQANAVAPAAAAAAAAAATVAPVNNNYIAPAPAPAAPIVINNHNNNNANANNANNIGINAFGAGAYFGYGVPYPQQVCRGWDDTFRVLGALKATTWYAPNLAKEDFYTFLTNTQQISLRDLLVSRSGNLQALATVGFQTADEMIPLLIFPKRVETVAKLDAIRARKNGSVQFGGEPDGLTAEAFDAFIEQLRVFIQSAPWIYEAGVTRAFTTYLATDTVVSANNDQAQIDAALDENREDLLGILEVWLNLHYWSRRSYISRTSTALADFIKKKMALQPPLSAGDDTFQRYLVPDDNGAASAAAAIHVANNSYLRSLTMANRNADQEIARWIAIITKVYAQFYSAFSPAAPIKLANPDEMRIGRIMAENVQAVGERIAEVAPAVEYIPTVYLMDMVAVLQFKALTHTKLFQLNGTRTEYLGGWIRTFNAGKQDVWDFYYKIFLKNDPGILMNMANTAIEWASAARYAVTPKFLSSRVPELFGKKQLGDFDDVTDERVQAQLNLQIANFKRITVTPEQYGSYIAKGEVESTPFAIARRNRGTTGSMAGYDVDTCNTNGVLLTKSQWAERFETVFDIKLTDKMLNNLTPIDLCNLFTAIFKTFSNTTDPVPMGTLSKPTEKADVQLVDRLLAYVRVIRAARPLTQVDIQKDEELMLKLSQEAQDRINTTIKYRLRPSTFSNYGANSTIPTYTNGESSPSEQMRDRHDLLHLLVINDSLEREYETTSRQNIFQKYLLGPLGFGNPGHTMD
jgi:hypothetical protein